MRGTCTLHKAFGPGDVDDVLQTTGLRRTDLRVALLKIFARHQRPLTQKKLLRALEDHGLGDVDRVSVYRNLNQFVAVGLIHAVAVNAYVTCRHRDQTDPRHHVVLFCPNCERHEELCEDNRLNPALEGSSFFAADGAVLISGPCRRCGTSGS